MENKKNNFKRISENRVAKIIAMVNQLTNLSNTSFYEYDDKEIIKIFNSIDHEAKKVKDYLLNANGKKKNKRSEL